MVWARTTAGLSVDQAAHALGFRDAATRTAGQRLLAIESGVEPPSRPVLLKMSTVYRRPLSVFYLAEPPRQADRGEDFRTLPGAQPPLLEAKLDALLRDIRSRQSIVKSILQDDDAANLGFIGSANPDLPVSELAARITATLAFSLDRFRSQPDDTAAFNYLRSRIEASGVFVLLLGNLGSHHSNIPVEVFRGFALADPVAPFAVINDLDARPAWSFTALHEIVHLWLGTTGVSGSASDRQIESYCNSVAGEILLPSREMPALAHLGKLPPESALPLLDGVARERRVSRALLVYRLLLGRIIDYPRWQIWTNRFRADYEEALERKVGAAHGGPDYYVVRRHRLGEGLLQLMRNSLAEGSVTYTKAASVLGVKPRNVDQLLFEATHGV